MALKKGKHVFCEKPTRSIAEGEILEDAVAKSGLVYQTGIEDRSVPAYMRMMDLANNGHLGEITAAYTGVPKEYHNAPLQEEPIPQGLDWQMWLGPARDAPYQAARCKFHFRWVKDYGIGIISDWGTHTFDMARKIAVGDDALPVSVELLKQPLFMDSLYNTAYDFAIAYTYPNGVKIFLDTGETYVRVEGTKGWIESPAFSHPFKASSREILDAFVKAGETHYRSEPMMEHRNFIDAIKCGKPVYMPAHAEKTLCFPLHAGSIAMDLGRNLKIEKGVFVDDEKANAMTKAEYRDLWKI